MTPKVWKSKRLWAGIFFFVFLIIGSFLYTIYGDQTSNASNLLMYDDQGELVGKAPFSPIEKPPFGSDSSGVSLGEKVLDGAKYTLIIVFVTVTMQMIISSIIGLILAVYEPRLSDWIRKCFAVFYYIPPIIWVFVFSYPLFTNIELFGGNMIKAVFYQMLVLVMVFLPTFSVYLCEEVRLFLRKDYIISAKVLGASKWHLIRKHVFPYMKRKLVLLFIQQSSQLMMLLVQMGFFSLIIGGSIISYDMFTDTTIITSLSNEWSGLIGIDRNKIWTAPWIITAPMVMFALSILVLNMMRDGIDKQVRQETNNGIQYKRLLQRER
ncbi:ABC transporter permease subunit [Gracilibacillus sp. Marseille-QA3620]